MPTPGNAAFVRTYRRRWGAPPDAHAAQGYAVGELYRQAWSRSAQAAAAVEPGAVRDALFSLDTETVFGRYRVGETGLQTAKTNAVIQWQRGRPVVVWPRRYATGDLRAA